MTKAPRPKRKTTNVANSQPAQGTENKPATPTPATPKKRNKGNVALTQPNPTPQTPKKKKPRKQSRDTRGNGNRR